MQLKFRVKPRREGKFWEAIVFYESDGQEEYLNEKQYQKLADWCRSTFHCDLPENKTRARRMAYDAFWFKNRADLDWFVIVWSGTHHQDV
jgi:hypothetical protein